MKTVAFIITAILLSLIVYAIVSRASFTSEHSPSSETQQQPSEHITHPQRKGPSIPVEVQNAVNVLLANQTASSDELSPEVVNALSVVHNFEKYKVVHFEQAINAKTNHYYSDYSRRFVNLNLDLRYFDSRYAGAAMRFDPSEESGNTQ